MSSFPNIQEDSALVIVLTFWKRDLSYIPTTAVQLTDTFCARKKMHEANCNQYIPYLIIAVKDTQYPELAPEHCS